jgi:D-psicose/D-tagatose/L-ribulose 3-epimerase
VMRIGAWLGAGPLVFGSPRNRKRGAMEPERAMDVAAEFFRRAAAVAADEDVVLCIEPNPPEYDCDFITRTAEGLELVERVAHPGFGLHVDASQITLSREPMPDAVTRCAGRIRHFHASEPMLGPIGEGGADHAAMAKALRSVEYGNWVSIEMRQVPDRDVLPELRRVMEVVRAEYRSHD